MDKYKTQVCAKEIVTNVLNYCLCCIVEWLLATVCSI